MYMFYTEYQLSTIIYQKAIKSRIKANYQETGKLIIKIPLKQMMLAAYNGCSCISLLIYLMRAVLDIVEMEVPTRR